MPEPAANHDLIEQANSLFWNPLPLDELMADVAPLDPDEHFDIPDLTEEEWQTFVAALEQSPGPSWSTPTSSRPACGSARRSPPATQSISLRHSSPSAAACESPGSAAAICSEDGGLLAPQAWLVLLSTLIA